jgi:hypothetical protein
VVGNDKAFEVILSQDQNTLLASLTLSSVTINTRAVALISKLDDACLLALILTASNAVFIKGNPTLNMPNCSIVSDSNSPDAIHFQGNAHVTADTLVSHGGITQTGGSATITLNFPAKTNQPAVSDPYASTLTHTLLTTGMPPTSALCTKTVNNSTNVTTYDGTCAVSGASVGPPNNNGTVIISGGDKRITGNWNIDHETVNLSPGTYWITDGNLNLGANGVLECTACDPATGAGITIIFTIGTGTTVGTFTAGANTNIGNPPAAPNFNAPGAGTFQDLLIIQDSNGLPGGTTWNTNGTFQGGPSTVLDGLVYFPKSDLTFNGNPTVGSTGCLVVVANTVTLIGDSKLNSTGCNGSASPPTVKTVALAE